LGCCFASRNNANDIVVTTVAMAYDDHAKQVAKP
jgi:hypothetical protein